MKYALLLIIAVAAACGMLPSADGTAKPAAEVVAERVSELADTFAAVASDSVITPEEGQAMSDSFRQLGETIVLALKPPEGGGFDWENLLYLGASVLLGAAGGRQAALAGVKKMPNSEILGEAEAKALSKMAGTVA